MKPIRLSPALSVLSLVLWAFMPMGAQAHPHVFIDARFAYVMKEGKVTGIRSYWIFDPIFSMELIRSFDADKNGAFDPAEGKKMADTVLENLKYYHYLTFLRLGGETLPATRPTEFAATLQKDRVGFSLLTPLPKPIDPAKDDISVYSYDPSYYIEVNVAKEKPAFFEPPGDVPKCAFKQYTESDPAYWNGLINFERIKLSCNS